MAIGRRNDNQFMLRLPDDLSETMKAVAAANNRSMNSEIISRLESTFSSEKALHPALADMLDKYIEQEVSSRLKAIAAQIGGA